MTPESAMRVHKTWNYEAYAAIVDDGRRHEIIEGEHFVNPAPNLYHQHVSRHLHFQLFSDIELNQHGWVFSAPCDVQLSDCDIVQPDIVVVLNARREILTPAKINGIPDLVVEILSPSNADYDLNVKRSLFEVRSVPEYWIVSPEEHLVRQLILVGRKYVEHVATDRVAMSCGPRTVVDLNRVW